MQRTAGLVFIACCALSALSLADARKSKPSATVSPASDFDASSISPTATTASTTPPSNTTTTTASTTPPSNTTTTTTATTTLAPNTTKTATTTPAANTTTPAATTTLAPNTTTPAPNTTTTATTTASTTSAPPSPTPPVGNYSLLDGDKTCLKAQVALQIRLVTAKVNGTFTVQPKETKTKGNCDETRVTFNLTFTQGFINFNFTRNVTSNTVFIDAVALSLTDSFSRRLLAGTTYSASNASLHLFPAKIGHSYSCRNDSLYMGGGLYLDVSNDKMQAFNLTKNDFGTPDPCPADQPDYRVAIAVGVTLLVLIVVVVVAYLLSRRKRMAGYQSL